MQVQASVCYLIKFKGSRAKFCWSSTPNNPTKGSIDLRVSVNPLELSYLARSLGCLLENESIIAQNLDAYNRLVVYAGVRPTVRQADKARELAFLVLDLNMWDAHYWASRFRELWWRHETYRPLLKVAKAFKLFFGIE